MGKDAVACVVQGGGKIGTKGHDAARDVKSDMVCVLRRRETCKKSRNNSPRGGVYRGRVLEAVSVGAATWAACRLFEEEDLGSGGGRTAFPRTGSKETS